MNKPAITVIITSEVMLYNNFLKEDLKERHPEINIVGMATTFEELLPMLEINKPEILLLSLNIKSDINDIYGPIKELYPEIKIIVSTETFYYECLKKYFLSKGADGFLHSNCFGDKNKLLVEAIYNAKTSHQTTCSHEPGSYYHQLSNTSMEFTAEELKIMPLMLAPYSIPKIAAKLSLTENEVKKSRHSIFEKTNSKHNLHFYLYALKKGLHRIS